MRRSEIRGHRANLGKIVRLDEFLWYEWMIAWLDDKCWDTEQEKGREQRGKQEESSKYMNRAVIIDRDPGSIFHPRAIW